MTSPHSFVTRIHKQAIFHLIFLISVSTVWNAHATRTLYRGGIYSPVFAEPEGACKTFERKNKWGYWLYKSNKIVGNTLYCYLNTYSCDASGKCEDTGSLATVDGRAFDDQYFLYDPSYKRTKSCPVKGSDPIIPYTGSVQEAYDLIELKGIPDIHFRLYYNSDRIEKWRHSFSSVIYRNAAGTEPRFNFNDIQFGFDQITADSNGLLGLANVTALGILARDAASSGTYITEDAACSLGWSFVKDDYHYSWVDGSVGRFENGSCKIYDSDGRYRRSISIYSIYSGRKQLGPAFLSSDYIELVRANGAVIVFRYDRVNQTWINQTDSDGAIEILHDSDLQETGYQFTTKNNAVELYDKDGKLISISYPNGSMITLNRDGQTGLIQHVNNNIGQGLTFAYETYTVGKIQFSRISSITDNQSRQWSFHYYKATGILESIVYPDTTQKTFIYDDANDPYLLTGLKTGYVGDAGRLYSSWRYNAKGQAELNALGVNADKNLLTIDYLSNGLRTVKTYRKSSDGASTTIPQKYLTQVSGPASVVAAITPPGCDNCGQIDIDNEFDPVSGYLLWQVYYGSKTSYGDYDNRGDPGYIVEADGTEDARRKDYTYDPRFHNKITSITEPSVFTGASKVTRRYYDDYANLTEETIDGYQPDGTAVSRTTTYQYNGPYHQLSQIDGPRVDVNDIYTLQYYPNDTSQGNARARLYSITGPDGTKLRDNIKYSPTGKVLHETRPNQLALDYTYYPGNDRLESLTETDLVTGISRVTYWTYTPVGDVESITRGYGTIDATTITLGYDDARRVVRITDGLGNYIKYTLDSLGNVEKQENYDASGVLKKSLSQAFDLYNRVNDFTQMNEDSQPHYNPDGTLDNVVDGKGNTTKYNYDNLKRLRTITQDLGGTDPTTANALTQLQYDVHDNLTSVTDANDGTTGYVYDDLDNLLSQTSPDTGTTTFTYDEAGNLATKTDAKGQIFTYRYNAYNRLTSSDAPSTSDKVSYTYDTCSQGFGHLCETVRNLATVDYQYNAFGDIRQVDNHIVTFVNNNQTDIIVKYSYNAVGRLLSITYPAGDIVQYTYDAAGHVDSVALIKNGVYHSLSTNIHYYPFGPMASMSFNNGVTINNTYDQAYRPFFIGNYDHYFDYLGTYDKNGNPTFTGQLLDANLFSNLTYDDHNRLTTLSNSLDTYGYEYDLVGNKTSKTHNGVTETAGYKPKSNRMQTWGSADPILDDNGNTTQLRGITYSYTSDDRLKSANTGVRFYYNGQGERIMKKTTAPGTAGSYGYSTTRVYVYGPNGELLAETGSTGKVYKEYVYLNGQPLSLITYQPDESQQILRADMNKDGEISVEDFPIWYFNHSGDPAYDVTGDGINDNADLNAVLTCTNDPGTCVTDNYTSKVYFIQNNHLGTPRLMTDSSGTPVWRAMASPFGKTSVNEDLDGDGQSVILNLRQPGQYYDAETGLYYNYYRYYDPVTGRYMTSDPIGLKGGMNTYAYVENNPLNRTDPSGQISPLGIAVGGSCFVASGVSATSGINSVANALEKYNETAAKLSKLNDEYDCEKSDEKRADLLKRMRELRLQAGKEILTIGASGFGAGVALTVFGVVCPAVSAAL